MVVSRREKEITELHAFSQSLATCLTDRDLIFAVQDYLSNTLRYRTVLLATAQDGSEADADGTAVPAVVRREAVKLMAANDPHASTIVDEGTTERVLGPRDHSANPRLRRDRGRIGR